MAENRYYWSGQAQARVGEVYSLVSHMFNYLSKRFGESNDPTVTPPVCHATSALFCLNETGMFADSTDMCKQKTSL